MTQSDQNRYAWSIVDEPITMPFLAGGYTQDDWNILNGACIDQEYMDDYIDDPISRHDYEMVRTKPYWCE